MARKIEQALDRPFGWLDSPHNAPDSIKSELEHVGSVRPGAVPVVGKRFLGLTE